MHLHSLRFVLRALGRGIKLRCPACGHGRLFSHGLHINETCSYCGVRFERASGESLGAIYLTSALNLVLTLVGFWLLVSVFDADTTLFLALWIGLVILFNLLFYRFGRALWVVALYLTGGVYADPDYEREYVSSEQQSTHYEHR